MPHLMIDYSGNLAHQVDMTALCDALRVAALETKVFPRAGVRVRAARCDHYSIADGDPRHGFIHIIVRLGAGRDQGTKEAAITHMFSAMERFLAPLLEAQPVALSMEMGEIDSTLSLKTNSIRRYLKDA